MKPSLDRVRRVQIVAAVVFVLASVFAAVPVAAVPGVAPDITAIASVDKDIDPGELRAYNVAVTGYDAGGTWTFSGTGLTVTAVRLKTNGVRLTIQASETAEAGARSLTVVNPDGLSDTFANAITVTGANPPPTSGDLTGHVFDDADGDGVLDAGEVGLSGVSVSVTGSGGNVFSTATDGNGDYTVVALPVGSATAAYTTPAGRTLTTGNASQTLTIVDGATTVAAPVGYVAAPTGSVTGHVFEDADGDGVKGASEVGLAGATVTIVDAASASFSATTDSAGNYTVANLAVGTANLTYTGPSGYTLTTGNSAQSVSVTDGGTATAVDVGYEPPSGVAPVVLGPADADQDIDPGETRTYRLDVLNYETGGTVTFSGTGVTGIVASVKGDRLRMSVTATSTAEAGWRSVTVTNPDGLSGTFTNGILVNGSTPPPVTGTVTGTVFSDTDGNGVQDTGELGYVGVTATFVDATAATWTATTDANGVYTMAVGVGGGTLTTTTPSGATLTTGNDTQSLTVAEGATTTAAAVGYQPGDGGGGTEPGPCPHCFTDVAPVVGITYTHGINECGAPIGIGAAWADVDNDGDQDLYTTDQTGPNRMYLNQGDTSGDGVPDFVDAAVALGLDAASWDSYAAVFADVDNDGDQDLYFSSDDGNKLYRNEVANNGGTLAFTSVSATSGLTDMGKVETATFGDIDNDGVLDLYLAKHMSCNGDNIDRLYHGNGDGTFSDWTTWLCGGGAVPCSTVDGLGFSAGFGDFDRDGDQDIYLVNDNINQANQPNKMIRNDGSNGSGGWIFTEVGAATGSNQSVNGMGLGMGDVNNDGWIDLAFSDAAPGHLIVNDGDGTYTETSGAAGVTAALDGLISWGTGFLDYDNNGWQDLFFSNGGISTTAAMKNSLLSSNGDGTFTDISATSGMDHSGRARGLAMADFDNDGWVDVFVTNYGQAPILMHNISGDVGNTFNHLVVTVEGTTSNRDGIGTELRLTTAQGTQLQLITSGSNHGGGSQKAAFFGLNSATSGTLTVTWPNGVVQNLGTVSAGTLHLVEPAS